MTQPDSDSSPRTGAQAVIADALARRTGAAATPTPPVDPARRPDVLFRVRREPNQPVSAWWMIGAFLFVSVGAVLLLNFVPGGH
ncbi:hypothetical protein [Microbacterium mangrovi]|nr:hypothetical protein [Microbacterium mangrovi]